MDGLHICAPAFYKNRYKARYLLKTAKALGEPVHLYGLGEQWENFFESKTVGLRRHLDNVSDDLVLCIDAADSVLLKGSAEIIEAYESVRNGKDIVIQSDRHCFPDVSARPYFDHLSQRNQGYIYPCAGGVMGKRKALIDAIDVMIDKRASAPQWMPAYDDDMGWWATGMQHDFFEATIDYKSLVSLCAYRGKLHWFELGNHEYGRDGNPTCVLHFAGMTGRRNAFTRFVELEQLGV